MKVPRKISFRPFWPFLGQKYIACGDKMVFSEVFGLFLPIYWCCIVKFCYMNIIYCFQWLNEFKNLTMCLTVLDLFLVPRSAVGTYGLASVRVFVRPAEISIHRNFLIFGTKLKLDYVKKVTFLFFWKKS